MEKNNQLRDDNIDLGIISKGSISLYYNDSILNYDIDLLIKKNFIILEIEGKCINDESELLFDLQEKLKLPDYAFKNYDSFEACLGDYEINESKVAIVIRNLNESGMKTIHILLNILADHSRKMFTHGFKLLTLIQVDNPNFKIIEPIGAINFRLWNDKEWFEGTRRK